MLLFLTFHGPGVSTWGLFRILWRAFVSTLAGKICLLFAPASRPGWPFFCCYFIPSFDNSTTIFEGENLGPPFLRCGPLSLYGNN